MLNKEKYAKEILDIVCQDGTKPAVIDNLPIRCTDVSDCHDCKFYASNNCNDAFLEWVNSEYKEPEIDWSKVPVDTCILVTDSCGNTIKRHFAKYNNKIIYAYPDGTTSWSFDNQVEYNELVDLDEKSVQIKKGVDCSEWYKD